MTAFDLEQVSMKISATVTVTVKYQSNVSVMVTVSAARKRAVIFSESVDGVKLEVVLCGKAVYTIFI
jgi:hypothetical protein